MKDDKGKTFEKIYSKISSKKVTLDWAKNVDDGELLEDRLQIALAHVMPVRLRALANERKISTDFCNLFNESFFVGFEYNGNFDLAFGCFWSAP